MVPFITEFGLLEYIGVLIEPLMRPVFKVPGYAAIDAVTSFVANPTLGIFFTNKLYKEKNIQRAKPPVSPPTSVLSAWDFLQC